MEKELQFGLMFGLLVLIYIAFVVFIFHEISSGERKWADDREKYLKYLSWIKRGYHGVNLED